MRSLFLLALVVLNAQAMAAGPGSPSQTCLTPFIHADTQGKKLFAFEPRVHTAGRMQSAVQNAFPDSLVCSPGDRIIDAGQISDADAYGADEITIMDSRMNAFVLNDLAADFYVSPHRRFIVYRPWGGPEGKGSVLGAQTLYRLDVDQTLMSKDRRTLSDVPVFPTGTDAFQVSGHSTGVNASDDK